MTHSHRRKTSKNAYFRMDVPKDVRDLAGTTSWQHSLGTADPTLAAARRAAYAAQYKTKVIELRQIKADQARQTAAVLVERAFEKLARWSRSMDDTVVAQLDGIAILVRSSWSNDDARAVEQQHLGEAHTSFFHPDPEPIPAIDDGEARRLFRVRAELIEGGCKPTGGLVYQELPRELLDRGVFEPLRASIYYLQAIVPGIDVSTKDKYDAVATAYLTRLAEHRFTSWPAGIREALAPLVRTPPVGGTPASTPTTAPSGSTEHSGHSGLRAMPISEALAYWRRHRAPGASAIAEATRAVGRFVSLFGDLAIGDIERRHVMEFRELIMDLPPQTELAKVIAAGRTLRDVIEQHRGRCRAWNAGEHEGDEPGRLAPGSVKKDLGALSQVLGKVANDLGEATHVAARIEVAGYTKTKRGQKRPRLSFTPGMMQTLFDSPMFTGCAGPSDILRTRPGNHVHQDELYWTFLFGVVAGPRLEEIGQIALSDIHQCDMQRTFGNDHKGSCTFVHITGTGEGQNVKNDESDRYVVLHEKLVELGFIEYVERRRSAGAVRLFDLEPDAQGKFTKVLSNRLNRYIDRVVTTDPRYVFHSMRHEFTDRAELSSIPARVANSIKGHAHSSVADNYGLVSILTQYTHLQNLQLGFIDWARLCSAARRAGCF